MVKRIGRRFFERDTIEVAYDILGKYIVRKTGNEKLVGKIIEVEAYIGPDDKAAHSYGGKITERNRVEYEKGGLIYIYLVYGMYWQLNFVTSLKGKPECLLVRALEPVEPKKVTGKVNLANGPGKLCGWLKLDKNFYGEDLIKSKRIWLEDRGERLKKSDIVADKRVGIDYAGEKWANKKWRFYIKNNKFVSKRNNKAR